MSPCGALRRVVRHNRARITVARNAMRLMLPPAPIGRDGTAALRLKASGAIAGGVTAGGATSAAISVRINARIALARIGVGPTIVASSVAIIAVMVAATTSAIGAAMTVVSASSHLRRRAIGANPIPIRLLRSLRR